MRIATDRRRLLMGGAMLGVAGLGAVLYPRRHAPPLTDSQFEALIPKQLGDWDYVAASGLVLPPQDQLSKTLYEQLLTRIYAKGGEVAEDDNAVMLLLAYSSIQEGRLQVHRPEVCYPAAGFTILDSRPISVALDDGKAITGRFLVAQREARRENILYWTRVGDALPTRWAQQRAEMAIDNLKGFVPDGLLGRVSVISADPDAAVATLSTFLRTTIATLSPSARKLLIGSR